MERVPEPELMDDAAQAEAYARANFDEVNGDFVRRFVGLAGGDRPARIADLGCGPADIPVRLVGALPGASVTAIDAAAAMLALGRERVRKGALSNRVHLVRARLPDLPFAPGTFDAVVSNSLVHHLADPEPFWNEVGRLARPGALVLVMDLHRPPDAGTAAAIVEREARDEAPLLQRDFYASLLAAFRLDEVRAQLPPALRHLNARCVSDRHWLVAGRIAKSA